MEKQEKGMERKGMPKKKNIRDICITITFSFFFKLFKFIIIVMNTTWDLIKIALLFH